MPISAQVFRPYFACQYPRGTYTIRLFSSGAYTKTVNLDTTPAYYRKNAASSDNLWKAIVDALNVPPLLPFGTFSYSSFVVSSSVGFFGSLSASNTSPQFTLDYSGPGDFDWRWLGLQIGATSSALTGSIVSSTYPRGTWFPYIYANDLGYLPSMAQVSYSAMTADGSTTTVDMSGDPTSMPFWWTMYLDGTIGVHGARMQRYRTAKPAWASAIGVATDAPYVPLDYPGGWWSYAVRGQPFLVGDMDANASDIYPLRIHAGPECPEGMDPIRGLRSPTVTPSGATAGRRNIRLAFLTG